MALLRYLFQSIKERPYDVDTRRVLYLNTPEFLDSLRRSMNNPDKDLDNLLTEMVSIELAPKLMVFDDIGAERPSDWVQERLYSIINFRVGNNLANIFTSNCSLDEIAKSLGSRIHSRILGCARPIQLTGKDNRGCTW